MDRAGLDLKQAVIRNMSRWYVVLTKRAGETSASSNLIRQGYEVYLPLLQREPKHRGRSRKRIVALFPRYLFLRLNEGSQALSPVHSTIGVTSVVRFGLNYATVPDQLIGDLRAREDPQSGLHCLRLPALPKRGSAVRIANGPFDGLEGIFERESGDDRVVVLLNLLGRDTRVQIPIESIHADFAA